MIQCPKCGSKLIGGPKFERDVMQREHLRYTCERCGYSMTTPTLDQKRNTPPDAKEPR